MAEIESHANNNKMGTVRVPHCAGLCNSNVITVFTLFNSSLPGEVSKYSDSRVSEVEILVFWLIDKKFPAAP